MTYGLVPDYIVEWHRALLAALQVDYFRPGLKEMNDWRDFLFVLKSLEETPGGPFSQRDLVAVIGRMRAQNKAGGNWALRFSKIMSTPEVFRDLVLEARRPVRGREPVRASSRTAGGVTIATEIDPAAEAAARPVGPEVAAQLREFRQRMKGPGACGGTSNAERPTSNVEVERGEA